MQSKTSKEVSDRHTIPQSTPHDIMAHFQLVVETVVSSLFPLSLPFLLSPPPLLPPLPPPARTNAVWEMEQRHKQDRHQQLKQQVREAFHMQRHQMHVRHQKVRPNIPCTNISVPMSSLLSLFPPSPSLSLSCPSLPLSLAFFHLPSSLVPSPSPRQEVELQARRDQFRLEELRQQHLLEKRQLPKRLKTDHKLQVAEARKAARNKKDESSKEKLRKVRVGRQSSPT